MRPSVPKVLDQTVGNLATEILPLMPTSFRQGLVGAQIALLMAVREEFDRGAARRVEENDAVRGLLRLASGLPLEAGLAERLESAARGSDDSLQIPALDAENNRLRQLLIELHAAVADLEGDAPRRLESAIWSELVASTERRKLGMAPF